ncbi:MAG: histidinol dehydrogenase [Candidatus Hydrogenedentes bacterium]|nr:histidinol dehydrogenase [Candidatus Hydrogenedentota bacterium]
MQINSDGAWLDAVRYCEAIGQTAATEGGTQKIAAVKHIVEDVRQRGDAAVAEYTERFDRVAISPQDFEVRPEELDNALAGIDSRLREIIERAKANIESFHSKHLRESWQETQPDGTIIGQRVTPLARVGVYVPGGKAFYPSSVLMNILPAKVAGVKDVCMVSPPSHKDTIHPAVLAAARIAGADRVFRIGGAQSIAALAYGTETIPQVVKITGPGNIFVTLAKSLVRGVADIDSEAGPSEVVVLADGDADPRFCALELLAQAEHDEEAMCILVTDSAELAAAVDRAVQEETARLPRRAIIEKALNGQGAVFITRSMDEAVQLTNVIAPEHLNIQTADPSATASCIENAGAMMLGPWTPVAVGDYFAGPNHILPTGRRARYQSPLTAEDFRKVTSVIQYSRARLARDAADIIDFATVEELTAHARAIEVRQ